MVKMSKYLLILQKYSPPIFNAMIIIGIGIVFAPFQPLPPKIFMIILFVVYNLGCLLLNKNRDLGMAMVGAYWKENYNRAQQLFYIILYTLSFTSIFFHLFFPFDLLLFNIVLLQVPSLFYGGMYFPNLLAGKMEIVTTKLP